MTTLSVLFTTWFLSFFAATPTADQTFKAVPAESSIVWKAKKITGAHDGLVPVLNGTLVKAGNNWKSGSVEANMAGLTVEDLKDQSANEKLKNHLKSEDFFATDKFPKSVFTLKSITELKSETKNSYNLTGTLTIKGITNEITVPATIVENKSGVLVTAVFPVDRTKYDIRYRSGSFFSDLGNKAIDDLFTLEVKILFKP